MSEIKKLKLILGALLWFMIYILAIGILSIINLFMGNEPNRFLDLGLYIGNVIAFGLSFYIMNQGRKLKIKWMIALGIFVFLINGWGILKFFFI